MHKEVYRKGKREEPTQLAQRIQRGLDLYSEKGEQIVWLAEDRCRVPSCAHEGRGYLVVFGESGERCQCPDFSRSGLGCCKHTLAALVSWAKRPAWEVRKVHDSRVPGHVWQVVDAKTGYVESVRPNPGDAYFDLWELRGMGPGRAA
jgi:hypothetical protein